MKATLRLDDLVSVGSTPHTRVGMGNLPKRLKRVLSLDDFETEARRVLPRPIYSYVAGGCELNRSLEANRKGFGQYTWITRVLRNTSGRTLATSLLGKDYAAPFGIAPMGICGLTAYRGDIAQASATTRANVPMILSGASLVPMEEVAKINPDAWFQAYVPGEPDRINRLLDRVEAAGFGTLVVTVDTPVSGNRENNLRAGFSTPLRPSLRLAVQGVTHPHWLFGTALRTLVKHGMPHFENAQAAVRTPILARTAMRDLGARDHLSWSHFAEIRKRWPGKLVIKGILDAEDAKFAQEHGADAIIVSNHGGRQLDGATPPLLMLPRIRNAVGAAYPIMIDGGFRRGNDVLLALALGANFVLLGRPFNYAAAVAGEAGLMHAISILASEILRNMALIGVDRLADLSMERLEPARH